MARFTFSNPLNAPLMLLIPTGSKAYGVAGKTYPDIDKGILIYGSFKTFGGTDKVVDGLYSVEKTAVIETWYRPDITSDCRIGVLQTGEIYEILGEPENISLRNQYMRIKVKQIKGGA